MTFGRFIIRQRIRTYSVHKTAANTRKMTSQTEDVLFEIQNNAGIVILNRPKSLNALNSPILLNLLPKLWEWERNKKLVIIKGAGRAFCAGGDVKEVTLQGGSHEMAFVEYNINHLIGNYKIPFIALIDGITMGGGLGVSVHAPYRVATENTVIAMPEVKIGLIPDVGGTYFLPRLKHHIGIYLAMTSNVIKGKDVTMIGVATHYVSSHRLSELQLELSHCTNDAEVKTTLDKFHEPVGDQFSPSLHVKDIDYCFSASTVEEIIRRLKSTNNEWAQETIKTMNQMCPLSLKLTLKALHRGAKLNLWQCLHMEYRLCGWLTPTYNFIEGVRALLVDKDNNPKWDPKTVEEVDDNDLEKYFSPLPIPDLQFMASKL